MKSFLFEKCCSSFLDPQLPGAALAPPSALLPPRRATPPRAVCGNNNKCSHPFLSSDDPSLPAETCMLHHVFTLPGHFPGSGSA